jgi:hypothetical protein
VLGQSLAGLVLVISEHEDPRTTEITEVEEPGGGRWSGELTHERNHPGNQAAPGFTIL